MRPYFRVVSALFVLAAILFTAVQLFASLDRGQIQGTVTDPQVAVMPGVTVEVPLNANPLFHSTLSEGLGNLCDRTPALFLPS